MDRAAFLDAFYRRQRPEGRGLVRDVEEQLPLIDYPAIDIGADPATGEPLQAAASGAPTVQPASGRQRRDRPPRPSPAVDLLIDELTPAKAADLLVLHAVAEEPIGLDPESWA